ncbi:hypothetical protein ZWY2020_058397 [Hordeum vulgare]|nr:hypothetical protein ZWY2020_058397 [Hordeum vulgare]
MVNYTSRHLVSTAPSHYRAQLLPQRRLVNTAPVHCDPEIATDTDSPTRLSEVSPKSGSTSPAPRFAGVGPIRPAPSPRQFVRAAPPPRAHALAALGLLRSGRTSAHRPCALLRATPLCLAYTSPSRSSLDFARPRHDIPLPPRMPRSASTRPAAGAESGYRCALLAFAISSPESELPSPRTAPGWFSCRFTSAMPHLALPSRRHPPLTGSVRTMPLCTSRRHFHLAAPVLSQPQLAICTHNPSQPRLAAALLPPCCAVLAPRQPPRRPASAYQRAAPRADPSAPHLAAAAA